ncbi:hypothetical protein GCM10009801_64240 [Streptomyces albiaxialis]|uniref:histidinol-phosphate transaminase n=1 Tax=Streptomyces albiaxialis TaxID=329523 RepID=A0ABP5I7E4_9ACTN
MRTPVETEALQEALCAALGAEAPVAPLTRLGADARAFAALDAATRARPTLVGPGTPYGPSTPAPAAPAVDALVRRAEALGVDQVLVPGVRRDEDTRALRDAGFVPVDAGAECVVRLKGEVDDVLRARLGGARLRDLRRRERAVAREVTWERIPLTALGDRPWARDACADLHRRRAEREGGSGGTPYTAEALDALARGPLEDRAALCVRRRGGAVVHAGLVVTARNGRGLHLLTQAADHDDPVARHNLHLASLYRLFHHARDAGLAWVHLGRGDAEGARRLGADLFVPLDHWLRAPGLTERPREPAVEPGVSEYASPPVASVPVPGPARFRNRPRFDLLDLSGNTNPFLGPETLYPELDTRELARAYLDAIGKVPGHGGAYPLGPGNALFTSGAVDAVMLLLTALASPRDRVCVTPPTFELYAHFARVLRLPVVEVPLQGADLDELDVEGILAADPRVALLCDPNNPVGTRLDPERVRELVTRARGVVVIDEAYVEFSAEPSYARLVAEHGNLIVLRTLSKAWGLASARCGVALAGPGLVDALRRVQVPFGFTDASQHAVRARLAEARRVFASVRAVHAERERLAAALTGHPAVERVFPSEANFLLVRLHKHERAMDQLRAAGLMVADVGHLVPGTCRVSVGRRRANDAFLAALSDVL